MYPIRICRTKNMEIWELRLVEAREIFCYISLIFNESEEYLAVDIHSNVDLQNDPRIDYEEMITIIECLYENMLLEIDAKISLHFYSINSDQIDFQDEEVYGSNTQQISTYLDEVIKEKCFKLVEKRMNLSLDKSIKYGYFCNDI